MQTLAEALMDFFPNSNSGIKIIGTRHGEKLYETLCTKEEMLNAEDLGDFYRIAADDRDLNYNIYYDQGTDYSSITDYNSHNTRRLDKEGVKNLLLSIDNIKSELK
jgi:UDP-glucose 4-epimerase